MAKTVKRRRSLKKVKKIRGGVCNINITTTSSGFLGPTTSVKSEAFNEEKFTNLLRKITDQIKNDLLTSIDSLDGECKQETLTKMQSEIKDILGSERTFLKSSKIALDKNPTDKDIKSQVDSLSKRISLMEEIESKLNALLGGVASGVNPLRTGSSTPTKDSANGRQVLGGPGGTGSASGALARQTRRGGKSRKHKRRGSKQ
jgi:hypothetical protein